MVSLRSGSVVGQDQGPDSGAAEVTSSRKPRTGKSKTSVTPQPETRIRNVAAKIVAIESRIEEAAKKGFLTSELSADACSSKIYTLSWIRPCI
jgi:hypothetical protein